MIKNSLKLAVLLFAGLTSVFSLAPDTAADNDVKDPNLLITFTSDVQGYLEECG